MHSTSGVGCDDGEVADSDSLAGDKCRRGADEAGEGCSCKEGGEHSCNIGLFVFEK